MKLVILSGRMMYPGNDGDYVMGDKGIPIFHKALDIKTGDVIQIIDTVEDTRRVFIVEVAGKWRELANWELE